MNKPEIGRPASVDESFQCLMYSVPDKFSIFASLRVYSDNEKGRSLENVLQGRSSVTCFMQSSIVCNFGVAYFASDLAVLSVFNVSEDQEAINASERSETPVSPSI